MELQKAPDLMFTTALLITVLLAGRCEAGNCYFCNTGLGGIYYDNCDAGVPPPSLKPNAPAGSSETIRCDTETTELCHKVTAKERGKLVYVFRGCVTEEGLKCVGFRTGCKKYSPKEFEFVNGNCKVGERSGNAEDISNIFTIGGKGSVSNSELRQSGNEGDIVWEICVCSGDLCIAGYPTEELGNGGEDSSAKMATAGMELVMINIAIAATSMIYGG